MFYLLLPGIKMSLPPSMVPFPAPQAPRARELNSKRSYPLETYEEEKYLNGF